MPDDQLLKTLAKIARERDPARDPRLEALVRGTVSEDERAVLRARALTSEAGREAYEAYMPLDVATRERIADRATAQLAPRNEPSSAPIALPTIVPPRGPVSARPRRGRSWPALAFAAAAAVLVGVFGLRQAHFGARVLPEYAISAAGGDGAARGSEGVRKLGPGGSFEMSLQPARHVDGVVVGRGFLVQGDQVRAWDVAIDVAESGAMRIAGSREALFHGVPAGRWEVVVAVGRPGTLPVESVVAEAVRRGAAVTDGGARLLRCAVDLGDAGGVR